MTTTSNFNGAVSDELLIWTNAAIAALPTPSSSYEVLDPLTPGLALLVDSDGCKSLQFTFPGGTPGFLEQHATFKVFDVEAARAYANENIAAHAMRAKKHAASEWTVSTLKFLPAHDKSLPSRYYEIKDPEVRGLRLRVNTAGRKFFYFRYTCFGKKWADELGEFGHISIEEARSTAKGIRAFIKEECS